MTKKIKTTDTNIDINTTNIEVIEISGISFEKDERYPWIDIYQIGNEAKEFIEQIDDEEIIGYEDLKIFALNWFFNNVEIVKNEGDNNDI